MEFKVYVVKIARILRKTQVMALKKNKSRLLKTTLVLMVIVQVEFSLVAGFWVGITYISNEPGDGVYKKLMALVKVWASWVEAAVAIQALRMMRMMMKADEGRGHC